METVELAPNEKRCSKCKEVKDRGEFYSRGAACKKCTCDGYKLKRGYTGPKYKDFLDLDEKRCSSCNLIKPKSEFNKSKLYKDGYYYVCKFCVRKRLYEYKRLKNLKVGVGIRCPVCDIEYSNILGHVGPIHGMSSDDLKTYGINDIFSENARKTYYDNFSESCKKKVKGDYVEINLSGLSFPKKFWSLDCEFARIKVIKEKRQVHFNPVLRKVRNSKAVYTSHSSNRLRIHLHERILDSVGIFRPVFNLRQKAGFYIQFYEQDEKILEPFEFWAKSGSSMRNTACLTTNCHSNSKKITIADHLWPMNAEYCFFEWQHASRKGANYYLDLIPISRTGFIVGSSKLNFKQYIGLEDCYKMWLGNKRRYSARPGNFLRKNNVPSGDWDLKEILPSGALRFVLSEPKAMPAVKQPPLKKLEIESKPMQTPDSTFEDWLTEIGENDSQPKEQSEDIAS